MPYGRLLSQFLPHVVALSSFIISAAAAQAQMCDVGEKLRVVAPTSDISLFGAAVALDKNRAVIVGSTAGTPVLPSAVVYEFDGVTWNGQAELLLDSDSDISDFATAAAIQGDLIAIGNATGKVGSLSSAGSVSLFVLQDGEWVELAALTAAVPQAGARFGAALALKDDLLIVGAPTEDNAATDSGGAYIFRFDGASWGFEQKIVPVDGQFKHQFGASVAVENDTIVVGTKVPTSAIGEAYVFHHDRAQWTQSQKLTPPDPTGVDQFGAAVAISGSHIAVGAPRHKIANVNAGAAYVFVAGKFQYEFQQQLLMPNDPYELSTTSKTHSFGRTLSLLNDILLVGAPTDTVCFDDGPLYYYCGVPQGTALLFRFDGSSWNMQQRMRPKYSIFQYDSDPSDKPQLFGSALALDYDHALLGSQFVEVQDIASGPIHSGAACFFDVVPPDCDNNGIPDACEPDCNRNLVNDVCDLNSTSNDCNADGVPDECGASLAYPPAGGSNLKAWGAGIEALDFLWLNCFTVQPGKQYISHIAIAWQPTCLNRLPVKLIVYEDPNNDGNPSDGVMIQSVDAVAVNDFVNGMPETDPLVYSVYPINPVYVGNVGEHFFIGAFAHVPLGYYPALSWIQSSGMQSWTWLAESGTLVLDKLDANSTVPFNHTHTWTMGALSLDCNGNGICDQTDIDTGFSTDNNSNGVPDDCEPSCVADLAPTKGGNGVVDVDDLLTIINSWGACALQELCPADIAPPEGNGIVDVDGLLIVINNWGPCV